MNDENDAIISQNDTAPKPGEGPWNRSRRQGFVRGARLLSHARERRGEGIEHVVWATGDTGKLVDGGRTSRENDRYTLFSAHNYPSNAPDRLGPERPGYGGYAGGVVALHNGNVYYYSCRSAAPFSGHSFGACVESFRRKGYRRHWTITQTVSASNGRSYDR